MKNLVIGASIFAIGAIFGGFSSYWLSVGYEKFGFHKGVFLLRGFYFLHKGEKLLLRLTQNYCFSREYTVLARRRTRIDI